ncbi:MAG: flippase-like domain-containing protein [Caldilineaceae bacterium]|nr:flippase-like domain-containing protein [Caldilineaceae bacterium]
MESKPQTSLLHPASPSPQAGNYTAHRSPIPTPFLTPKRLLLLALCALISLALLLWWGGGSGETLALLAQADSRLLGLAVLIHYSGFALRGWRWQRLLAGMGHPLPYGQVTGLLISGWFVSALLPARAGDAARIAALRLGRRGLAAVPVADSLSSIVLERVLDMFAILGLGGAFGFFVLADRLPGWILSAYALGGALLLVFGGGLLLAPSLLGWLAGLWSHRYWQVGLGFAGEAIAALRSLLTRPGQALLLVGGSLYIWLCDALLLWLVVLALGVPLPFAGAAFAALTVDVFATVPLTPGGIGQIEAAYAGLLALLSLPVAVVPAAVLLTRAISYWSFLLFSGIIAILTGSDALFLRKKTEMVNSE